MEIRKGKHTDYFPILPLSIFDVFVFTNPGNPINVKTAVSVVKT
jgi:hypothetical protein